MLVTYSIPSLHTHTHTCSEHLLFILEIITAQFLVLPQQPSSLLPVSGHEYVCECVCVCDVCVCVYVYVG